MMELIQSILSSIDFGQIVAAIVLALIVPLFAKLGRYINEKVKAVDNNLVTAAVAIAVRFVEQKYKTLESVEKYRVARDRALSFLKEKGITISEESIQTAIEAAVEALTREIAVAKN